MNSINTIISRLRNPIKAVNKDGFVTDRVIYSSIQKFAPNLLKREDSKNLLYLLHGIFQTLPYVELIEVDKVDSQCFHLKSGCKIKRTEHRLPGLYFGYYAPLIKSITGITGPATDADDEGEFQLIEPGKYASVVKIKSFKYNKTRYCWFADGYLWFPNLEWDAVRIDGLFHESIDWFNCNHCKTCIPRQEQHFAIPEYLFPELEGFVLQDFGIAAKIPSDPIDDKQSILRP